MNYTPEQLDQIEKFASIYLKISDMAVILDIAPEQLRWDISQKDTEVSRRYYRGKRVPRFETPLAVNNNLEHHLRMISTSTCFLV